jgi:hypothetical protein
MKALIIPTLLTLSALFLGCYLITQGMNIHNAAGLFFVMLGYIVLMPSLIGLGVLAFAGIILACTAFNN